MTGPGADELASIAERYARRDDDESRYSLLRPEVLREVHGRQRALMRRLAQHLRWQGGTPALATLELVEVGCGNGSNLLELLRLGLRAEHLTGIELLPELVASARARLPAAVTLWQGDASTAELVEGGSDLVLASTVFSSILDETLRQRLAAAMWRWLRPGGAVIWYDFTFDNPRNPDVRGVKPAQVRQLFPAGRMTADRVTLAPPLARAVGRWHPAWHGLLNAVPLLRTHLLAWIEKPA